MDFLIRDVRDNGGSCSETINMHGHLWDIKVCQSPWGPIIIRKEVTELEAWSEWLVASNDFPIESR